MTNDKSSERKGKCRRLNKTDSIQDLTNKNVID